MSYGGKFLLENPLTSKAWQEKYLNELMMDERVHLAVADQCNVWLDLHPGSSTTETDRIYYQLRGDREGAWTAM